jgi:hypothetical protein
VTQGRTSDGIVRRLRLALWASVVFGIASCVGNPVPEPPHIDPVDLETVFYDDPSDPTVGGVFSRAGSLEPGVEVWAWNLERDDDPVVAVVQDNGSFELEVWLMHGDELRFQVRTDEGRSRPIDGVATDLAFVASERPSCVDAPAELDLAGRAEGMIRVVHECATAVDVVDVRWRRELPDLTLEATSLGTLAPGDPLDVVVTTDRNDAEVEEIILIELDLDGTPARFPVSVYTADP